MFDASTDRAMLTRQYADKENLAARASIYAFQQPQLDFPTWVLDHLPHDARGGLVLDVGCGPGWCTARATAVGTTAIGLDLSWGMVHQAAAAVPAASGWVVGDATSLPVRSGACSAALALHMLYHVPDPARAVAELRRVVRPGGTLLAVLNGADHMNTYRSLAAEAADRTEWMHWPSDRANLGHTAMFEQAFPRVVLDELHGKIVLRDVAPLLAYASSAREFYEHQITCSWEKYESRLAELARHRLARDGLIEITTHSGVFVCTASE